MDDQISAMDISKITEQIKKASLPIELVEKAHTLISRIEMTVKYGGNLAQLDVITKYIDWIIALPWDKTTNDSLDVVKAKEIMDSNHYGLNDIKARILEYLSVLTLQHRASNYTLIHAPVLFFVGLSGTGKTTIAQSIAQTLGRVFIRIPFGGLSAAYDLRGVSKIKPEAEPGMIIKSIRRAGQRNPVILLDEIDRVTPENRGEIMGVLIELLDPEQNAGFVDHYIDYPLDLSQVIFIATANNTNNISPAVLDRLEVIHMPSYTDEEKIVIAKKFIFPRLLAESGLTNDNIQIDDVVWHKIARLSGYDPGVRSVEHKIETIVRKVAYRLVKGEGVNFVIGEQNIKEYIAD